MLEFFWHLRGSIPLDSTDSDAVALGRMERLLSRQQKMVNDRGSDYLAFDDRNPFGADWPAMAIYDHGRFWIEQQLHGRRLCYDLRSLYCMGFCLIVASIAFFIGLAGVGFGHGLRLAAWMFFGFYGGNIILALLRVPSAIRKAASAPS
jgi:hypothetical protein